MMSRERVFVALLVVALLLDTCTAKKEQDQHCPPSHCGTLTIEHPFRMKGNPPNCGGLFWGEPDNHLEMSCDENNRTILYLLGGKYYVKEISYKKKKIRLLDAGLEEDNYCSIPQSSFPPNLYDLALSGGGAASNIVFVICPTPVHSFSDQMFSKFSTCNHSSSTSLSTTYLYAVPPSNLPDLCNITVVYPIMYSIGVNDYYDRYNYSISYIHQRLLFGVELNWCQSGFAFEWCTAYAYWNFVDSFTTKRFFESLGIIFSRISMFFAARASIGILCLIAFLVYKYRRRHLSLDNSIEDFLQGHNNFKPIRYSFSEIKQMTKGFKEKLGEGGNGSVFKAKLRSGHLVAIKLLGKSSKANGQDFISEVATIGRIHHVNVVPLVGFCAEGSKRALVYDFMPNGSLDKFIFSTQGVWWSGKGSSSLNQVSGVRSPPWAWSSLKSLGQLFHPSRCLQSAKGLVSAVERRTPWETKKKDKFIFSGRGESKTPLSWERMYDISLGVARGIEYIHRGCDMQILHFDIKPHNILLDVNFVPKVSDFGLAKLYSTDDSIVSLTAARGTLGYIAPEFFYKHIGGVSYKADVYSFGMLLLEMVGRRKNVNAFAEHTSQIYFPTWIYDRVYQGEDMELGDITEELKKLVKKMTVVALWCIQMKPVDRPSMSEVLDMLEGEAGLIQMPPKPSFCPPDDPIVDHGASSSSYIDISTTIPR